MQNGGRFFLVRFSLNTVPDLGGCWGLGFLVVAGVLLLLVVVFRRGGESNDTVLDRMCVLGWVGGGVTFVTKSAVGKIQGG